MIWFKIYVIKCYNNFTSHGIINTNAQYSISGIIFNPGNSEALMHDARLQTNTMYSTSTSRFVPFRANALDVGFARKRGGCQSAKYAHFNKIKK